MLSAILILFYIFTTIIIIKLFPVAETFGKSSKEEGFIYQIQPLLSIFAKFNKKLELNNFRQKFKKKWMAAGEPYTISDDEFFALKELGAILFMLLSWFIFGNSMIFILAGGILGFMLPNMWLNDVIKNRRKTILRRLPDFLDLLTLTVEAGLDFGSALAKVISVSKHTPLIEEFELTLNEIRLGTSREMALRNMTARIDLPDVTSFTSSLIQADQLGASLGPTLRIQSEQMLVKRMQRAEEMGSKAPVKMLVPLFLFIFPAVFLMIFGPLAIKMLTQ